MGSNAVAVTGAGGFVGSAVVRLLVRSMHTRPPRFADGTPVGLVVAMVRPGGSRHRLQEINGVPGWSVVEANMADSSQIHETMAAIRPRAVLHLALDWTVYQRNRASPRSDVNVAPLESIFSALRGIDGARIVYTGSAWVLAAGNGLSERAPLDPKTPYARDKIAAEQLLPVLHRQTGVNWIGLRLFNIFGRYEHPSRLLPYLVRHLTGGQSVQLFNPDHVRDFTDVDTMAKAYLLALHAPEQACNSLYHIGSGRGINVRQFARTVASVTGHADSIEFGAGHARDDPALPVLVSDPGRAEHVLGWTPPRDPLGRIRIAARWWQEHLLSDSSSATAHLHSVQDRALRL